VRKIKRQTIPINDPNFDLDLRKYMILKRPHPTIEDFIKASKASKGVGTDVSNRIAEMMIGKDYDHRVFMFDNGWGVSVAPHLNSVMSFATNFPWELALAFTMRNFNGDAFEIANNPVIGRYDTLSESQEYLRGVKSWKACPQADMYKVGPPIMKEEE